MGLTGTEIPATPGEITAEYLTAVLRESGTIKDNSVKSVAVETVPAGSGFAGQAAHLKVEYEREERGAPKTMFAKMSSANAEIRSKLRSIGVYETEAGFYRDLSRNAKVRVPQVYACLYDAETAEGLLLIEEIRHLRFGDHVTGCTAAEARAVVSGLARMQAHNWNSERLAQCGWLRSPEHDRVGTAALYRAVLPKWEQQWGSIQPPEVIRAAHALGEFYEAWIDTHLGGPWTLVHGDCRADNLAFDDSGEVLLFDWQATRRTAGSRDLAYYMASLATEVRRAHENELLELYHRTLVANGVRGYSMEEVRLNHRRSMGSPLSTHVIAGGMLDFSSERGQELARIASQRMGAMIEDHDFGSWTPAN
jgi:hypothetical protein